MAVAIIGSVGKDAENAAADVKTVQALLNGFATELSLAPLSVTGVSDAATLDAIIAFQSQILGFQHPDGRVDPGGRTIRGLKAGETTDTASPSGTVLPAGTVIGDLDEVNPKILMVLRAVAAHYGRSIRVTSGRRSPTDQARAMWQNWTGNLKRGTIYRYLKGPGSAQREQLDGFFNAGDRASFDALVVEIAPHLSMHLAGEAIDIAPKSDLTPAMLQAICSHLRLLEEQTCYHFDTREKALPDQLTAADFARWPVA